MRLARHVIPDLAQSCREVARRSVRLIPLRAERRGVCEAYRALYAELWLPARQEISRRRARATGFSKPSSESPAQRLRLPRGFAESRTRWRRGRDCAFE